MCAYISLHGSMVKNHACTMLVQRGKIRFGSDVESLLCSPKNVIPMRQLLKVPKRCVLLIQSKVTESYESPKCNYAKTKSSYAEESS